MRDFELRMWMSILLLIVFLIATFCYIFELINFGDYLIILMLEVGFLSLNNGD